MNLVLSVIAFAALMWGIVVAFRGSLVATSIGVVLASICFSKPFYFLQVGPAPVTLDRLAWAALMVQYAVWRGRGWHDPKPWTAADGVMIALLAWLGISTYTMGEGLEKTPPEGVFLFLYLIPAGLYWIGRQMRVSESALWGVVAAVAAFGVYLGATGYLETHDGLNWLWPRYMAQSNGDFAEFFGRARGPLLNPIGNGLLLTLGLLASLVCAHRREPFFRLLGVAGVLAASAGCWFTYTRSVWLGAAAAAWVFAFLGTAGRSRRVLCAVSLIGAIVATPLAIQKMYAFQRDEGLSAAETADSVKLRPILAALAWESFQDHPFIGVGLARNQLYVHEYAYNANWAMPLERGKTFVQHNVFLSLLVETGAIGLGLFLVVLASWTRSGLLLHHRGATQIERLIGRAAVAALAALVVNGMFHETSLIPGVNAALFLMTGITGGLALRYRESTSAIEGLGFSRPLATRPASTIA